MKIVTNDPYRGDVVTGYLEDGTFWKYVKPNHFMLKYQAYGIQNDTLLELKALDCIDVQIMEETGKRFTSKLSQWLKKSVEEFGHGKQRFLPIDEMEEV